MIFPFNLELRHSIPEEKFLLRFTKGNIARLLYFKRILDKLFYVEGDVMECGVGKAKSFQMLALLLQNENRGRRLYGFDSFEGFPEISPEDMSMRNPKKGEWKKMDEEDIPRILILTGLDPTFINSYIHIVKGFFKDTLPKIQVSKIVLLHLDVDLYLSYKECLEYLFPKVVEGGIVLFDEYDDVKFPGARKAIDEYFKIMKYKISKDKVFGKYYLIKE